MYVVSYAAFDLGRHLVLLRESWQMFHSLVNFTFTQTLVTSARSQVSGHWSQPSPKLLAAGQSSIRESLA